MIKMLLKKKEIVKKGVNNCLDDLLESCLRYKYVFHNEDILGSRHMLRHVMWSQFETCLYARHMSKRQDTFKM